MPKHESFLIKNKISEFECGQQSTVLEIFEKFFHLADFVDVDM